jgi:hypothetical protein
LGLGELLEERTVQQFEGAGGMNVWLGVFQRAEMAIGDEDDWSCGGLNFQGNQVTYVKK